MFWAGSFFGHFAGRFTVAFGRFTPVICRFALWTLQFDIFISKFVQNLGNKGRPTKPLIPQEKILVFPLVRESNERKPRGRGEFQGVKELSENVKENGEQKLREENKELREE